MSKIRATVCSWLLAAVLLIGCAPSGAFADRAPAVLDAIGFNGGMVVLMTDRTIRVVEDERLCYDYFMQSFPCRECTDWTDIVQIRACNSVLIGLRSDGSVTAEGPEEYVSELAGWDHVTELYVLNGDYDMVAGIQENGDVLLLGIEDPFENYYRDEGMPTFFETIDSWPNVRKMELGICAAGAYAAALHRDGTVSFTGCIYDVGWSGSVENVIDIACSGWGLIALKEDGTCIVNGEDSWYREITDTWTDLKQVDCGDTVAIGLRNDGTFVVTREDYADEFLTMEHVEHFTCSVYSQVVAYRTDGTIEYFQYNGDTGEETVREWTDIERVLLLVPIVVALRADGTLISTEGEILV